MTTDQIIAATTFHDLFSIGHKTFCRYPKAGLGTRNYQYTMNLNRSTNANLTTEPPFLGMCC